MDFAVLFDGQRCFSGWGNHQASSESKISSFWINDFYLTDETPWVTFDHFEVGSSVPERFTDQVLVGKNWKHFDKQDFLVLWEKAQSLFRSGQVRKVVLALEDNALQVGKLPGIITVPKNSYFYAFSLGGKSGWGITPELLLSTNGETVQTMAVAGTFAKDQAPPKELDSEHSMVVDFFKEIAAKRNAEITISARENVAMERLFHYRTLIEFPDTASNVSEWVRDVHPTPALGIYPRNPPNLKVLREIRGGISALYGAPFGVNTEEGSTFVVMIRGQFLQNGKITRPFGVGVISESIFDKEWNELQLKRSSVEATWKI